MRWLNFFITSALLSGHTALADWTDIPSQDFTLAPPPAEGSAAYRKDFEVILEWQTKRTPEQCAYSATQRFPNLKNLFGTQAGVLSDAEVEHFKPLLSRALRLADRVAGYQKGKFGRPRPYRVDSAVQPCIPKIAGARAYPSSHATQAATGACLLAQLLPERSKTILKHGKMLAQLRVVVGVHHPSDVKAGEKLGTELCKKLLSNDEFLEEFEAISL